jgi:hypothetical protein
LAGNEFDEKPQALVSGFPENRYEALEESRRLLGLNDSDFRTLLKVLCRTECGTLDFSFGNVSICLSSCGDNEVHLTLGLGNGPVEKSADYRFRSHELGVPKKHKKVHDFEAGE